MRERGAQCPFEADGYSNIFGSCRGVEDTFLGYGLDRPERPRALFRTLTASLNAASECGGGPHENHRIPAGYTYLAQFTMHDMSHNVSPLPGSTRFRRREANL